MSTSAAMNIDQRRSERWRYTLGLILSWGGGKKNAHTMDISMSGAFVETDQVLSPGTAVKLQFQVLAKGSMVEVQVKGRVARKVTQDTVDSAHPRPGLGVQFQEFASGEQALEGALQALRLAERYVGQREREEAANRRKAPRVKVGLPVSWGATNPPTLEGQLSSLSSSGGFMVHTESPCEPGSRIYLRFELPDAGRTREVKAVATVVRVVEEGVLGMGIVFELSTVAVEFIERFVDDRKGKKKHRPKHMQGQARRSTNPGKVASIFQGLQDQNIRPLWIIKAVSLTVVVGLVVVLLL